MSESSFRDVLKNRHFLLLWLAQILSQFADKIFFLYMVVLVTTDQFSNSAISALTLVFTIPAVFFGSFAGVFVDRWNKKTIMIVSNVFRALFIFALPVSDTLLYYYFITFLVSTLTQFFAPAETSMIPVIVEKKDLLPANSLFMGTMLTSVVLGFALGEPVISRFGEQLAYIVLTALYGVSALLLLNIKARETKEMRQKNKHSFLKEFKEGLLYVRNHYVILFSLVRLIIIFSAFAALSVLVIGYVNDILYLKPAYFGYLLSVAGLGMGIGAGIVGKLGNRIGKEKFILTGFIVTGISLIVLGNTNQIARIIGYEKITQQKELFSALSVLSQENNNTVSDIKQLLQPETDGDFDVKAGTRLRGLTGEETNSLAALLGIDVEKLSRLINDPDTGKQTIGSFTGKLADGRNIFSLKDGNNIILENNAEKSEALRFFLRIQTRDLTGEFLNNPQRQDNLLNAIMTVTEKSSNNVNALRNFLKLNEDGLPETSLATELESLGSREVQLAVLLNTDQEKILNERNTNTLGTYLASVKTPESEALRTILSFPETSIIKSLLKQEASRFEILFAFFMVCFLGIFAAFAVIPLQTILQEIVEENMRGKVFGVQNMAVNTAMTLPMAMAGLLADFLDGVLMGYKGVAAVMVITGVIVILGGLIEFTVKPKELHD